MAVKRLTPTIELRLDWLRDDHERLGLLAWLRRNHPGVSILATCRRVAAGGKFRGGATQEVGWLARAAKAGCAWVDLGIETARVVPWQTLRQLFKGKRVLLSHHDFRGTPRRLPERLRAARALRPAAVKIAAQATSIQDSLRTLRLARRRRDIVAVPIGEVGLPARVLALREGSALAYAPVAAPTAPGQVDLNDLIHRYRAHKLTRETRVYGVIGDPVSHSLGPLMHNEGFIARKVDAVYLPFLVKDLRDFLKVVPEFGVRGFSITIPHKQAILRHLDECEPLAAEIGAVNTVVVHRDGSLYGCNTDYVGVLRALERHLKLKGSRVLLFGAGGGARAAAFALARAGAVVGICARREGRARELARAIGGEALPRRALRTESFDAIINTTPVGMFPHMEDSPLAVRELNCRIVMDMIYRPRETRLLKLARRRGCSTVSGLEMFLAQGFAQWEIWMGRRAPEAAMRRAVLEKLREEERGSPPGSARRGR